VVVVGDTAQSMVSVVLQEPQPLSFHKLVLPHYIFHPPYMRVFLVWQVVQVSSAPPGF